jgi:hypothetical protein
MEELFELFKGLKITYPKYEGIVCGYNEDNFIIAVETKSLDFFRAIKKDDGCFMLDEYKDLKYRYALEDESAIMKQFKKETNNGSTKETSKGYIK